MRWRDAHGACSTYAAVALAVAACVSVRSVRTRFKWAFDSFRILMGFFVTRSIGLFDSEFVANRDDFNVLGFLRTIKNNKV